MLQSPLRLSRLGPGARAGLTCMVLVMAGGYVASLAYLEEHYAPRDEDPELSLEDLVASFHGIEQRSLLLAALEGEHGRQYLPDESERKVLLDWLHGDDVAQQYDFVEGDELAPADLLDLRCVSCHARAGDEEKIRSGEHSALSLETWPDIKDVVHSREFHPVPVSILAVSTHVHASTLPLLALAAAAMLLASGGARFLKGLLIAGSGVGLLADLLCMWLARLDPIFVPGIVAGGLVFGVCLAAQWVWILGELWLVPALGRRDP